MRLCPTCQTEYPDGVAVCSRDGALLGARAVGGGAAGPTAAPVPKLPLPLTSAVESAARPVPPALDDAPTLPFLPAAAPAGGSPRSAGGNASTTFSPTSPRPPVPAVDSAPAAAGAGTTAAAAAAAPAAATSEIFDSLVGATLAGRYLIIRRIGEGGMGAVYEAKHTIIGKRVAVKVLLEKFLTKSDFVARLLQEARLASAIGHEHIVDVTDFGTTDDGRAFVAMEFLDGESLAQLVMREAPLPVERSLRITRQVASALGAAHDKGIVHRDVKPENVYLIRRGDADFVKVVDFGISKAVKQGQGDDTPDYHLTHTGLLLGTPLYMSPEQARGDEDLDHRVDVWAMGVMLYECLTGEVPFRANNYLGIISQVLTHTALPPSKLRPELGIPEAVEAVVMRAMEKDRNRRYALMSDVERDLERLLAGDQNVGGPVTAAPATAPAPRAPARGRMLVWGAAVTALIAGVAMVLERPEPTSHETDGAPAAGSVPGARAGAPAGAPLRPPAGPAPAAAGVAVPVPPSPAGPASPGPSTGATAREPATASRSGARVGDGKPTSATVQSEGAEAQVMRQRRGGDGERTKKRPGPRRGVETPVRSTAPGSKGIGKRHAGADDPAIRGALPSRSGEGYPDN